MTLHQFTIFAAIAKHKNVTRASEDLHITQPGVSQQMRELQEYYGAKLYERTATGIELTDAGQRFLSQVTPILEQVKNLRSPCSQSSAKSPPEQLALAGTPSISAFSLPPLLARFRKSHPDVLIDLRTNQGLELETLLLKQKVEIAITNQPPKSPRIRAEPFRREKVALVVSKSHPLARARRVSSQHLERTPILIRSADGRDGTTATRVISLLEQQYNLKLTVGMRFESPAALEAAIKKNMGIGIVHEDAVKHHLECGEFKAIKVPGLKLEGQSYIAHLDNKSLSKQATNFLELLRSNRNQAKSAETVSIKQQ